METNLINFIDPIFDTKIQCSAISDDLYSIENLVSKNQQQRNIGFMAYRVVKPPIDIEINLMCKIELCLLKIWTKIDSLKSTGFEVLIKSNERHAEYQKIGQYFNLKENGIQFLSNSGRHSKSKEFLEEHFATAPFYHSAQRSMRNVKSIKLTIKQTERCCVPVIKRIEVWGNICRLENGENRLKIQRIISDTNRTKPSILRDCSENSEIPVKVNDSDKMNSLIPEAFLDAITYEIMALPMVLPSGKVIDNSTLQRFNSNEEKWGRASSDPFTGQTFNENRKPILNVVLKSQIDAFLLANCNLSEISSAPRTIGTVGKRKLTSQTVTVTAAHRSNKNQKLDNAERLSEASIQHGLSPASSTTTPKLIQRQSLDDVVQNILKSRKYTRSISNTSEAEKIRKCFQNTETNHNCSNILYNIKLCSHFICRNCLIQKNLNVCKCGKKFKNFDVDRHYNREISF